MVCGQQVSCGLWLTIIDLPCGLWFVVCGLWSTGVLWFVVNRCHQLGESGVRVGVRVGVWKPKIHKQPVEKITFVSCD